MPLKTDKAYAAGLIDGEGSITANQGRRCTENFSITVAVCMCDYEPLEWLRQKFGGRYRVAVRRTKAGRPIFYWTLHCRNAANFLEMILPYLKVKRTRAINAIALARRAKPRGMSRATAHIITEQEVAKRRLLAQSIKRANFS